MPKRRTRSPSGHSFARHVIGLPRPAARGTALYDEFVFGEHDHSPRTRVAVTPPAVFGRAAGGQGPNHWGYAESDQRRSGFLIAFTAGTFRGDVGPKPTVDASGSACRREPSRRGLGHRLRRRQCRLNRHTAPITVSRPESPSSSIMRMSR
jgi:hypothetical protein